MVCTELFGEITVAFEFTRYAEHRLKLFGSLDRKTTVLPILLIKFITSTNELV